MVEQACSNIVILVNEKEALIKSCIPFPQLSLATPLIDSDGTWHRTTKQNIPRNLLP
jgi:hypothetical protein